MTATRKIARVIAAAAALSALASPMLANAATMHHSRSGSAAQQQSQHPKQ
jgi:nucleoside-specific outer membrane channel protein Tsx